LASITNLTNELAIYQYSPWFLDLSTGLNLTGCTAIASLRENFESTAETPIVVEFIDRIFGQLRLSLSAIETAILTPKTYVWDLRVTPPFGEPFKLRYGRAVVVAAVSGEPSTEQTVEGAIAAAIARHNADLLAHPDLQLGGSSSSYEIAFDQATLTIANILIVTHNLGTYPSAVTIYDQVGELIEPDRIEVLSINMLAITLDTFAPIAGTWRVSIAP
jgi:hypothetical protein